MPLIPPIYIVDNSGQQWALSVSNTATPAAVPVNVPFAVPFVYVNSVSDGTSWQLSIAGNPPPIGMAWGDIVSKQVTQGQYPAQLLVTAPNGTVYGIQVATVVPPVVGQTAQGTIETALPVDTSSLTCISPMSALAGNVLNRLEDPDGIFFNEQFEVLTGLAEAENLLMLLVGRPTQVVGAQFNLALNTPWQTTPTGIFLITDVYGPQSRLRKVNLYDMDFNQSSWGSEWENDTSPSGPLRWGPIGFNKFFVHPATSVPQTVLIDAIQYPVPVSGFPYSGATDIPFHEETFQWLEMYTEVYCRIKEAGQELQTAMPLYQNFLTGSKRLSQIEERRDDLVFSAAFGAPAGVNSLIKR